MKWNTQTKSLKYVMLSTEEVNQLSLNSENAVNWTTKFAKVSEIITLLI